MHVSSSYPLSNAETRSRTTFLNPGTVYTPWLYMDGASVGSGYQGWQNAILNRAALGSPLTARIWGDYNPATRNGTINVRFVSDTATTLLGNVLFVITEDSCIYSAPNGDQMHNHVTRDYMPNHIGTAVTLRYHDSVTVSYPFTISSSWVDYRCEIVAMIQNQTAISNVKEIWQGAKTTLSRLPLPGIEENNSIITNDYKVSVSPNPCVNQARFAFALPNGTPYNISVFDVSGRTIKSINQTALGSNELVSLDLSSEVTAGVYFYRFESSVANTSGKIIVK